LVAVSFATGLSVYATLATLSLLARAGLLSLPVIAIWLVDHRRQRDNVRQ
jgi:hypothetical protein